MTGNKAQLKAYRLMKEYRISNPSLDDLLRITTAMGYEIVDYSPTENADSVTILLRELSLEQFVKSQKAFVYSKGEIRLLFVCDTLSPNEKRYAIAHELGHIAMGHMKNGVCNDTDVEEEYEANEFAHYLLNPGNGTKCKLWIRRHALLAVVIGVCLILGISTPFIIKGIMKAQSYYGEYYITESGEKYHDKNCMIIKGKTNIRRLTKEDYECGKYQPCQICLSDTQNHE